MDAEVAGRVAGILSNVANVAMTVKRRIDTSKANRALAADMRRRATHIEATLLSLRDLPTDVQQQMAAVSPSAKS